MLAMTNFQTNSKFLNFIPDICVFHNVVDNFPCPDGIAAAWVVWLKFAEMNPNLKFVGMTYGTAELEETFYNSEWFGKNILAVDFSFNAEIVNLLKMQGNNLKLIDHHKSFLKSVVGSKTYDLMLLGKSVSDRIVYQDKLLNFDSWECGATITWKELFPDETVPPWLEIIKDNDLFKFHLDDSELIHYGMAKLRRTFSLFSQIHSDCLNGDWEFTKNRLIELGRPSVEKKLLQFEKILSNPKKFQIVSGVPFITLNKSEMMLKSRIAKYANKKFGSEFSVILDKELTRVRVKGDAVDLLELFSDLDIVGHSGAASFDWGKSFEELKELIAKKLEVVCPF
jgi:hypothetical protein